VDNRTLEILGVIVGLLLAANAWYFKDIVKTLQEIRIELAKLLTKHDSVETMCSRHDEELRELKEDDIRKLRERLHALEGGQKQIASHLELDL